MKIRLCYNVITVGRTECAGVSDQVGRSIVCIDVGVRHCARIQIRVGAGRIRATCWLL